MRSSARLIVACLAGMAVLTLTAQTLNEEMMARQFGLTKYVEPHFPVMAQEQGIDLGLATVAVAWEGDGSPSDVVVLRANDVSFGIAAREAVLQWHRPPNPGGREVAVYDLKFNKLGVVVSRTNSVSARMATQKAADAEPLRLPSAGELDAPVKAIAQPMPAFPNSAKGRWDEARVVVEFYVDENGRVRAPAVREATAPEFAAEALSALQRWQYETPRKNGQPTVMTERWAFQFRKSS
jgi:TonB family protein